MRWSNIKFKLFFQKFRTKHHEMKPLFNVFRLIISSTQGQLCRSSLILGAYGPENCLNPLTVKNDNEYQID